MQSWSATPLSLMTTWLRHLFPTPPVSTESLWSAWPHACPSILTRYLQSGQQLPVSHETVLMVWLCFTLHILVLLYHGVPQGFILSPLLLSLFAPQLRLIIRNYKVTSPYADEIHVLSENLLWIQFSTVSVILWGKSGFSTFFDMLLYICEEFLKLYVFSKNQWEPRSTDRKSVGWLIMSLVWVCTWDLMITHQNYPFKFCQNKKNSSLMSDLFNFSIYIKWMFYSPCALFLSVTGLKSPCVIFWNVASWL